MKGLATRSRFAREANTLWRDTGMHVLVLPESEATDVIVLGGGGAVLWRLLDHPLELHEIEDQLRTGVDGPEKSEITACLEDLMMLGVVAQRPVGAS